MEGLHPKETSNGFGRRPSEEEACELQADLFEAITEEIAKNADRPVDTQMLEDLQSARGHPFSVLTQESITRVEEGEENESDPEPISSDDDFDRQPPVNISELTDLREQLLAASEHNCVEIVQHILHTQPSLASSTRDQDGYTPLHRAAYSNHIKIIRLLLLAGAAVNARTNNKWTPLHSAVRWGNARAASLLIHNGADVNAVTDGGHTALHLAAEHAKSIRYKKVLLLLLLNPCIDVSVKNKLGFSARDLAQKTFAGSLFDIVGNDCSSM